MLQYLKLYIISFLICKRLGEGTERNLEAKKLTQDTLSLHRNSTLLPSSVPRFLRHPDRFFFSKIFPQRAMFRPLFSKDHYKNDVYAII
jgi:hypothetical protein